MTVGTFLCIVLTNITVAISLWRIRQLEQAAASRARTQADMQRAVTHAVLAVLKSGAVSHQCAMSSEREGKSSE